MNHRKLIFLTLTFLSFTTSNSWALDNQQSKHLLLRAGFGAQPELIEKLSTKSKPQAVSYLLALKSNFQPPPNCVIKPLPSRKTRKAFSNEQRVLARKTMRKCGRDFKIWYLNQLIADNGILNNQMTLFWQNHFTSSIKKVKAVKLIYDQHQSIQKLALGNFKTLLTAMVNDPAMLLYLDNVNNTKSKPNENLARELLELFTLGEGHYSEQDVLSAAKALTGLSIDGNRYRTVVRKKRHDNSTKRIFNNQPINSSNDLITAILNNPQTAIYITQSIWSHFISEVNDQQIKELAQQFSQHWEIKKLVKSILLTNDFWQDNGQMIKSPVELVISSAKIFQIVNLPNQRAIKMLNDMGQNLFDPPNVKGWPQGKDWIDENKLIVRSQFTDQLARAISSNMAVLGAVYCQPEQMASLNAVPIKILNSNKKAMRNQCQQQLTHLVTDPSWQLK